MEENPQKKINIDKDKDRLSNLSKDVLQCILEFLPIRDAATTCVLSSKWRYVWSDHPSLVLDSEFWDGIQKHKKLDCANIVSSILLLHVGLIQKFIIDVPRYVTSSNIDMWLTSLCRRRHLKELGLNNSDNNYRYNVPYCVLLNSELTHLSLSFCYIPKAVGCCFTNIQSLYLKDVEFRSTVLNIPSLTSLFMKKCIYDAYDFEVSAPKLASLTLRHDGVLNLTPFLKCTGIDYLYLSLYSGASVQADGKNLVELLAFWPRLSKLMVDGYCFKELTTGNIPDNDLVIPLNLTYFALWGVSLDSELIAWILYILKNSPLLQTFEIWFAGEQVMTNDIDEPLMRDLRIDQLRTVIMNDFTASRNMVMFVKILLKCAPFLEKMLVEEDEQLDLNERMKILKELFSLQKKYRNTDIIFAPNLVSD